VNEVLKPYPKYCDSGIPWLGKVPEHWSTRRIKTLFRERVEKGHPDEPLLAATQNHGVIQKKNYETRTVTAQKDLHLLKLVNTGDFVISLRSFQGGIEVAHCRGIISPAYTVLISLQDVDKRYYQHLLKSSPFIQSLGLFVTGIREGQNIDYERLSRSVTVFPPPPEQSAIAKYLAHAIAKIDAAIAAKKKVIALLEEEKRAIIQKAVTKGLDPKAKMKDSGVPWIGEIPEGWEIRKAKQVCRSIIDCKNRTPDSVTNGSYTVIRTTCIRNGQFSLFGSYKTDEKNYSIWTQRGGPKFGDVFFSREAPIGEAALVPDIGNICLGQRMMYFRPNPELLDPEYLLSCIYCQAGRRYIEIAANGSTVGHLRLGQVSSFPIIWCDIKEQKKIVSYINAASMPIKKLIESVKNEISLLHEYRTRLVADVVTGKLDVRKAAQGLPDIDDTAAVSDAVDDEELESEEDDGLAEEA
jgi:type I restriction enzyme, S subunit